MTRRRKQPDWTPASTFKVTKLKPNGPKPGQSVDDWLYGKEKGRQEFMDDPRNRFNDLP